VAAYSVKARWLLNEASSGTTPTEVADDEGTSDLTIGYGDFDAEWTSDADGNGLDFIRTTGGEAIAELADLSGAGTIGGLLEGTQEASLIMVARTDTGATAGSRTFFIGSDSGNGELAIIITSTTLELRWAQESGAAATRSRYNYDATASSVAQVFQFVCDSGEADAEDRVKFYLDGSLQNPDSFNIALDDVIETQDAGMSACIGNRGDLAREINGAVFYMEVGTGLLTSQQLSDSLSALQSTTDADWQDFVAGGDTGAGQMGANF
jgi:hypothetical protein